MRIPAINGRTWKVIGASVLGVVTLLAVLFATPILGTYVLDGNYGGYGYGGCFYCTQTQGGWGQDPSGENVGTLLADNWGILGTDPLVVGDGNTMTFTTAAKVELYLPAGGPAASLTGNYVDPSSTSSGILGGQVTALKLNVLFSDAGIGMICPGCTLGDLEIASGPFAGQTVDEFLVLAEEVLGGDTSNLSGATISDVSDTATLINENFIDCEQDNGFLVTP